MRHSLPLLIVLLTTVTACSRGNEQGPPGDGTASNAAEAMDAPVPREIFAPPGRASRESGPDIGPDVAPGVAFTYRYAFRLGPDRVAEAQQAHQRLCERYGLDRCRITGMDYRAANADDIEAMLSLSLDPRIAGQFGRESVQAVIDADGTLADSQISGTDAVAQIDTTDRGRSELGARLAEIEARLRRVPENDKGELERQLESEAATLRQQIRALGEQRRGQQASLAMTPMLLRYGSGDLAPGPAPSPTLREALSETGDDFADSLTFLLVVLVRLSPWLAGAALIWAAIRYLRRRFAPRPPADPAEMALGI